MERAAPVWAAPAFVARFDFRRLRGHADAALSHGGDVKTILAPALLVLFLGGCMPVEAVGRVLMIAGEAGKPQRPPRPQSNIEMVRCTMKDGSSMLTTAKVCNGRYEELSY